MKDQALFSSKDKSKKLNCCQLQFLFGALRVNKFSTIYCYCYLLWIPHTIFDQNFDLKSQCAYYMRTKYPGFFTPTQPTF